MAQVTKKHEHELTKPGRGMDLSFLGKPHEYDPRRTYSTTATDWQTRVDFDRLRKDRLARARLMMEKHDLGALVNGATATLQIVVRVTTAGTLTNTATRTASAPGDLDPGNDSASAQVTGSTVPGLPNDGGPPAGSGWSAWLPLLALVVIGVAAVRKRA